VPEVEVAAADEFPPGSTKIVRQGMLFVGVYNCGGELYAIEDRCSHDDGPLCEGDWDEDLCRVICLSHGSAFDSRNGDARSLPATEPSRPIRCASSTARSSSSSPRQVALRRSAGDDGERVSCTPDRRRGSVTWSEVLPMPRM
jgi:3-phenylpropionate/trans-cinnamate dioxygenase ferredoxin subunit